MSTPLSARLAAAFVALGLGGAGVAWACTCVAPGTATERLDRSDVVFLGTVGSSIPWERHLGSTADQSRTRFEVDEAFKGTAVGDSLEIVHRTAGAACGIVFGDGERWLVFARRDEHGALTTGLCDWNEPEADATADLAELRGE